MTGISYQVIFKGSNVESEMKTLLMEVFDENYVLYNKESFGYIEGKYQIKIDEELSIAGFNLILEGIDADPLKIMKSFTEKIADNDNVSVTFKYYDSVLYRNLQSLYRELFEIEMRLREVITFIFIDNYKDDVYDLLKEIDIHIQLGLNKHIYKNIEEREKYLSERLENEFFHILFSDYVKLTRARTLKQDDLFVIAEMSNNYDEFRNNILRRGIVREEYLDFMNSIKEDMENLERVRNCVAHNRTPSDDDLYNYELSASSIRKKIEAFIDNLTP